MYGVLCWWRWPEKGWVTVGQHLLSSLRLLTKCIFCAKDGETQPVVIGKCGMQYLIMHDVVCMSAYLEWITEVLLDSSFHTERNFSCWCVGHIIMLWPSKHTQLTLIERTSMQQKRRNLRMTLEMQTAAFSLYIKVVCSITYIMSYSIIIHDII